MTHKTVFGAVVWAGLFAITVSLPNPVSAEPAGTTALLSAAAGLDEGVLAQRGDRNDDPRRNQNARGDGRRDDGRRNRRDDDRRNVVVRKNVNINVRGDRGRWVVRPWRRAPYFGTVVAGVALGTVYLVAAPPPPPAPNLCWYWTDPSQTRGYWDYC